MRTIAILHGWAGGAWHTKKFVKELQTSDFKVIKDASAAEIIFAHSAGCYKIPKRPKAKLIVLVGPPYWPGKSLLRRLLKKKGTDWKHIVKNHGLAYAVKKSFWEVVYAIAKPSLTFIALINHRRLDLLGKLNKVRVILVRNDQDYFSSPELELAAKDLGNVHYIKSPGHHDDYYTNPRPYIDLLLKEI